MPPRRSARSNRTNPYDPIPPVPLSPSTLPSIPSRVTAAYGSPFTQASSALSSPRQRAESGDQDPAVDDTNNAKSGNIGDENAGIDDNPPIKRPEKRPRGRPRSKSPAKKKQKQAPSAPVETFDAGFDIPVDSRHSETVPPQRKLDTRSKKAQQLNSGQSQETVVDDEYDQLPPGYRRATHGSKNTVLSSAPAVSMPPPPPRQSSPARRSARNKQIANARPGDDRGFLAGSAEVGNVTFNPAETMRSIEHDETGSIFSPDESSFDEAGYQPDAIPTNQSFETPLHQSHDYRSYTMESSIYRDAAFASDRPIPPSTASSQPDPREGKTMQPKKMWLAGAPVRDLAGPTPDEHIQAIPEEVSDQGYAGRYKTRSTTSAEDPCPEYVPPLNRRVGSTNPFAGTPGRTPRPSRGQIMLTSSEDETTEDDTRDVKNEARLLFTKNQNIRPTTLRQPSRQAVSQAPRQPSRQSSPEPDLASVAVSVAPPVPAVAHITVGTSVMPGQPPPEGEQLVGVVQGSGAAAPRWSMVFSMILGLLGFGTSSRADSSSSTADPLHRTNAQSGVDISPSSNTLSRAADSSRPDTLPEADASSRVNPASKGTADTLVEAHTSSRVSPPPSIDTASNTNDAPPISAILSTTDGPSTANAPSKPNPSSKLSGPPSRSDPPSTASAESIGWNPLAATSQLVVKALAQFIRLGGGISRVITHLYGMMMLFLSGMINTLLALARHPSLIYLLVAILAGFIALQAVQMDFRLSPENQGIPSRVPIVDSSREGGNSRSISLPDLGWLAVGISSWVSALLAWRPSFHLGHTIDSDQFQSIKTDLSERIMKELEDQLPDAVHLTRDANGKIQVPSRFWQALRELIKDDQELLSLDATKGGDVITDKHWAALASRIQANNMSGSSDLVALDVEKAIQRDVPQAWEQWMHQNVEKTANLLQPYLDYTSEDSANIKDAIRDYINAGGLEDVILTKHQFVDHIQDEFSAHHKELEAELETLRGKITDLAQKFKKVPVGLSKTEVESIVVQELQHVLGKEQLDKLASHQIDQFWLGDLQRQVNFFSPGNGAEVGMDLLSPPWDPSGHLLPGSLGPSWFYRSQADINGPKSALQGFNDAGDCWCTGANKPKSIDNTNYDAIATLPVSLSRWIQPEHFVVEHLELEKLLDPGAAPKDIEIWAYVEAGAKRRDMRDWSSFTFKSTEKAPALTQDETYVKIGQFRFDNGDLSKGRKIYSFGSALAELGFYTDSVVVRAVTNHGADHTCLYRVRMFGKMSPMEQRISRVLGHKSVTVDLDGPYTTDDASAQGKQAHATAGGWN